MPVANIINPAEPIVPNFSADEAEDVGTVFSQDGFHLGEMQRIVDMVKKGDVASLAELTDYVNRTATHPLLQG